MARLAPAGIRVGSPGRILGLVLLMTPRSGAGIDIYVPSLPSMTEYFHTSPALVQLTFTMYLLGYGSAQLAMGAASEILGRRPVVEAGSLIYTATALGVALSPTVSVLLAFRFLQGVALSATGTLNRSILTDTFSGAELAKASNAPAARRCRAHPRARVVPEGSRIRRGRAGARPDVLVHRS